MTERDYLTVAEYAKLKGISRQSAYCHPVVQYDSVAKAKVVKLSALTIDEANKARQIIEQPDSKVKTGLPYSTDQLIDSLQSQVSLLTEQLRMKDEQITELNQRLRETLAVVYKQYVDDQPKPLQDATAGNEGQNAVVDAVPADDHPQQDKVSQAQSTPIQPASKAGKVSFWDRLFHRNDAV